LSHISVLYVYLGSFVVCDVCSLEGGATPRRDIDRELVGQDK